MTSLNNNLPPQHHFLTSLYETTDKILGCCLENMDECPRLSLNGLEVLGAFWVVFGGFGGFVLFLRFWNHLALKKYLFRRKKK